MNTEKRLVVVLGMHRSGTSALARGLAVLGVELGADLMPPSPDNPRGYWEDMGFYNLNEELLRALDHAWDDLAWVEADAIERLLNQGTFFTRALALVRGRFEGNALVGIKDPRFSLLLPFWRKVFEAAAVRVSYVVSLRHPLSVADSLMRRDAMEKDHAIWLWVTHYVWIAAWSAEVSVVVDYDELVNDPASQFGRVARALELPVDRAALEVFTSEFMDGELRHAAHAGDEVAADPTCDSLAGEIYGVLRAEALKPAAPDPALWAMCGRKWEEDLGRFKSLFGLLSWSVRRTREREAQAAEFRVRAEQLAGSKAALAQRLERIQKSAGWRFWMMLRRFFGAG